MQRDSRLETRGAGLMLEVLKSECGQSTVHLRPVNEPHWFGLPSYFRYNVHDGFRHMYACGMVQIGPNPKRTSI
jgi:hypothetical protein